MSTPEQNKTTELKLTAVTSSSNRSGKGVQEFRDASVYLHLAGPKQLPIELGTGRSAIVLLATYFADLHAPQNRYYAVKFLRDDPDPQYSEASAQRFFTEAQQMQRWGRGGGNFVDYEGWGAIRKDLTTKNIRGEPKEYWWKDHFGFFDEPPTPGADGSPALPNDDDKPPTPGVNGSPALPNDSDTFKRIKEELNLQGPFYIMQLCQGTLEDLLEGDNLWVELPTYHWIDLYRSELTKLLTSPDRQHDLRWFYEQYLDPDKPKLSGYDILNSFKVDTIPNKIRNNAVLQLFSAIAEAVEKLHAGNEYVGSLAHRDIKPGNIFLHHHFDRVSDISIRLSDLGYVMGLNVQKTKAGSITYERVGDTLRAGRRGVEYQAPGSQFYRAPEQSDLPIEVRVNVDDVSQRTRVQVKGTKLSGIEPNDWLMIDDLRDHTEQAKAFTILQVEQDPRNRDLYELILDDEVPGDNLHNLHAQITKSTGFHTDGYSLGAILYDLVSGGKNPEHFYTYCLRVFTRQFTRGTSDDDYNSVEGITEVLCPKRESGKTSDSIFGRSFQPYSAGDTLGGISPRPTNTQLGDALRPSTPPPDLGKWPEPTAGGLPSWRIAFSAVNHNKLDPFIDQSVELTYARYPLQPALTWAEIWRAARATQGRSADAILEQIANLIYAQQPVRKQEIWDTIWTILRIARGAETADDFLRQTFDLFYNQSGQTPQPGSIWELLRTTQSDLTAPGQDPGLADRFIDRAVELSYPSPSPQDTITWGDIWRAARSAQDYNADTILERIANLIYKQEIVRDRATWNQIWAIVHAARSAESADHFLNCVVDLLYPPGGRVPEPESIWDLVYKTRGGINADAFLNQVVNSIFHDGSSEQERKRKIRNLQFRNFHVVADLLRDKRGVPIPRSIIKLIVSCMMRGIDGAFYTTHPQHGFDSDENIRAAREISKTVQELLQKEFDLDAGTVPDWLDRGGILFGLRSLSSEELRRPQGSLPAAPAQPRRAPQTQPLTMPIAGPGDTAHATHAASAYNEAQRSDMHAGQADEEVS